MAETIMAILGYVVLAGLAIGALIIAATSECKQETKSLVVGLFFLFLVMSGLVLGGAALLTKVIF